MNDVQDIVEGAVAPNQSPHQIQLNQVDGLVAQVLKLKLESAQKSIKLAEQQLELVRMSSEKVISIANSDIQQANTVASHLLTKLCKENDINQEIYEVSIDPDKGVMTTKYKL